MLETQIIPLFQDGEQFPHIDHIKRINRYKKNELLFKGNHTDAFIEGFTGTPKQKELLYISVNLPSIICKKSADFLFGEALKILSGKGDDTNEQRAFDRIYENNHLNISTYESALSNAYFGDAFIKVRFGQEFGGMLPPEIDPSRSFIENVDPKTVFPETFEWDNKKIKAYHIAVPRQQDDGSWILTVESHYPSKIVYTAYDLTPETYTPNGEVNTFKIRGERSNERYFVNTGVPIPLVVHIPNTGVVGQWEGIDDLTEHHAILDEINNRLSQISDILDKHSNPAMAVPSGLLSEDEDGNASFRVAHDKVFEVLGKDDIIPSYITWDGQLQSAFQELDKLIDLLLTTAEIPSVALGRGDSGTSGSSGLAIKWRMNSLLTKINRKRQYYDKGLKTVLYIAQQLETNVGLADYNITIPVLKFNDGLPKDEMEQANITAIRTGGAKTMSQKTAIMQLNNMTEEQADQEIKRINEETESLIGSVDQDFGQGDEKTADLSFVDQFDEDQEDQEQEAE